jgi:hypothetical protein
VVVGGFITGDTLTVGTPGGLTPAFSNGTLTLSGTAGLATYQTALDSVDYGFSPANGDPTGGGSHTTRAISWSVNDGVVASSPASSTLNVVHVAPTVTAGGTVSYGGGGPAVVADPTVAVVDPDSGNDLISATVAITSGFQAGDQLNFTDQNGITGNFSGGTLSLTGTATISQYDAALDSITYSYAGADPTVGHTDPSRTISWAASDGVAVSNTGTSTIAVAPCYCRGTMIRTERGEIAVEDLRVGDRVATLTGQARAIKWIGSRHLELSRHPAPEQARPIVFRANAVAEGMPRRDLRVSPDHAVLVDGVLVLARLLVNGASVMRDDNCASVTYYHIELETHDILVAEGMPAESYLDTGNRGTFENGGVPVTLHPAFGDGRRQRIARSCRPYVDHPERVEPIWQRLTERVDALGFAAPAAIETTRDAGLHVVAAGRVFQPVGIDGGRHTFVLPPVDGPVRLVSRAARPCDRRPWVEDHRRLGVMVAGLTVKHGPKAETIALDDGGLERGWWAVEGDGASMWRWTDGDAELHLAGFGSPASFGSIMLQVAVSCVLDYPVAEHRAEPRAGGVSADASAAA